MWHCAAREKCVNRSYRFSFTLLLILSFFKNFVKGRRDNINATKFALFSGTALRYLCDSNCSLTMTSFSHFTININDCY